MFRTARQRRAQRRGCGVGCTPLWLPSCLSHDICSVHYSQQLTLRTGNRVDCTLENTKLCLRRCDLHMDQGTPLNGCTELPSPAHTHAEPSQPDEPVDAVDESLDERKKTEIFMRWTPPDDHGSPITLTEV